MTIAQIVRLAAPIRIAAVPKGKRSWRPSRIARRSRLRSEE